METPTDHDPDDPFGELMRDMFANEPAHDGAPFSHSFAPPRDGFEFWHSAHPRWWQWRRRLERRRESAAAGRFIRGLRPGRAFVDGVEITDGTEPRR